MSLAMNREVFITCAVTGSGGTQDKSPHVPRSPEQIAKSAIDAAKAGAAVVHCHVRDPETGKPSRKLEYYREVTDRIRDSDTDVVLNLTAGMGGDLLFDGTENMNRMGPKSDMAGAAERARSGADNTGELLRGVQELMSRLAGPIRSADSIREALGEVHGWLRDYGTLVAADAGSRRSLDRTFLVRDILTTAYVYLSAMADYLAHGGRSRGSVLYSDAGGGLHLLALHCASGAEAPGRQSYGHRVHAGRDAAQRL